MSVFIDHLANFFYFSPTLTTPSWLFSHKDSHKLWYLLYLQTLRTSRTSIKQVLVPIPKASLVVSISSFQRKPSRISLVFKITFTMRLTHKVNRLIRLNSWLSRRFLTILITNSSLCKISSTISLITTPYQALTCLIALTLQTWILLRLIENQLQHITQSGHHLARKLPIIHRLCLRTQKLKLIWMKQLVRSSKRHTSTNSRSSS